MKKLITIIFLFFAGHGFGQVWQTNHSVPGFEFSGLHVTKILQGPNDTTYNKLYGSYAVINNNFYFKDSTGWRLTKGSSDTTSLKSAPDSSNATLEHSNPGYPVDTLVVVGVAPQIIDTTNLVHIVGNSETITSKKTFNDTTFLNKPIVFSPTDMATVDLLAAINPANTTQKWFSITGNVSGSSINMWSNNSSSAPFPPPYMLQIKADYLDSIIAGKYRTLTLYAYDKITIQGSTGIGSSDSAIEFKVGSSYAGLFHKNGALRLNQYTGTNFYGTLAHRLGVDASGNVIQDTTTTGVGSGSVTSVATGYGLSGGTITSTGTIIVDTSAIASQIRLHNDSLTLATSINLKVNISDTASMLSPYAKSNVISNINVLNTGGSYPILSTNNNDTLNAKSLKAGTGVTLDTATAGAITINASGGSFYDSTLMASVKRLQDTATVIRAKIVSDSSVLQTAIALKANIASPTFTGVPAAPTAAIGTNTTQLATTQFVQQGAGRLLAYNNVKSSAGADVTEDTLFGVTIPASSIGINGSLHIIPLFSCTNSAGTKNFRVRINGTAIDAETYTTIAEVRWLLTISNRNSASSQITGGSGSIASEGYGSTSSIAVATFSINTAADMRITVTAQKNTTGDAASLESFQIIGYY